MTQKISHTRNHAIARFQGREMISLLRRFISATALLLGLATMPVSQACAAALKLVAFGDSLTAGYQLPTRDSFASQLEKALKSKGLDVEVLQGGVSGDTTAAGLARLDWTVPEGTKGVIVELGANDALRGLSPENARQNLDQIITRLKARGISVYLAGMIAPINMGVDYGKRFDPIYAELAAKHSVPLYPFFLEGIAGDPKFLMKDGLHPTKDGVARIVELMLPGVETWASGLK